MRIVSAFVLLGVLGITPAAFADSLGCGGDDTTIDHNADMSVPHDLAMPRDQASPRDLPLFDARRDRRRRRRSAGAGLVVLSGLGACGISVARRRVRA